MFAKFGLMLHPAPGTPADVPALARAELTSLLARLLAAQKRLAAAGDAYTRAHLDESAAQIVRAFEARLTTATR